MIWNADQVRAALDQMRKKRVDVFGSDLHKFELNKCLRDSDVAAFEGGYRVQLPGDYREFLTSIGNGGAGPFYGIFRLGEMDDAGTTFKKWGEEDGFVGTLSKPFPLASAWNDLAAMPDEGVDADSDALDIFDQSYWNPERVNGAIPICHLGCALRIWLVLTGPEAGHLWQDDRAEYGGLYPVTLDDGSHATFSSWYRAWLANPQVTANR